MADLMLVRPNDMKAIYGDVVSNTACEPPYQLATIAAYVRESGYSVWALDAEAENLSPQEAARRICEQAPVLVGIIVTGTHLSASTQKMQGAGSLAAEIKKQSEIPVFMWGLHPSSLPERTGLEEPIDYVIKGGEFARNTTVAVTAQRTWQYTSSRC